MTDNPYNTYRVEVVNKANRARPIHVYGRFNSAYNLVDKLVQKMNNRYRRQMLGRISQDIKDTDEGVDIFVECTIRAHNFQSRKIQRHFRIVTIENDPEKLSKTIRQGKKRHDTRRFREYTMDDMKG